MSASDNQSPNEMEISQIGGNAKSDFPTRLGKPREKPVDKRKAPEKDDSQDLSETSFSAVKNPTKKLKMSTTGFQRKSTEDDDLIKDDESALLDSLSETAEARLLVSTAEGEDNFQLKGKDEANESGDSNNSDKFYSQIKEMEEKDKSVQISQSLVEEIQLKESTFPSIATGIEDKNAEIANWAANNNKYARNESSSLDESVSLPSSQPVHFLMKVLDPRTNDVIYETKGEWIKSHFGTVNSFLKTHKVEMSSKLSGYSGDISSRELSPLESSIFQRPRQVSLGSTIARPSDASTINRPSINPADHGGSGMARKTSYGKGRGKKAKDNEPLFSSTLIGFNLNAESVANGEDHSNGIKTLKSHDTETSTSSEEQTTVRKQRGKGTPKPATPKPATPKPATPKSNIKTEQKGNASSRTSTTETSTTTTNTSSSRSESDVRIKSEPGDDEHDKKRVKLARGEGFASLQSVDEFNDPNYVKSAPLWSTVTQGEVVFARWRDKSYYSGQIIKKGMNDTWQIHFEDDIEDVASETHILPIKILGTGTWSVYCPSNEYKPEIVIVVGQKFLDGKNDLERIEYAVKSNQDGRIIKCARKNLTLNESDARDMRKSFQNQELPKAADLSLDNIVAGPRRRVGGTSPAPSDMLRKLVAGAFDASSTDDSTIFKDASTPTPKRIPTKGGRRGSDSTPASEETEDKSTEMQLKTPSSQAIAPGVDKSKTPSTSAAKETPKTKSATKRGKKLFHGMQFFLTASGGATDTPGKSAPILPYDKDEYRDLITTHGGLVLDVVGKESQKGGNVFLISDNYARTVKYIYALAAGTPCVSYKWIEACIRAKEVIDYKKYELDSGVSLETGAVFPAHDRKPLKGVKIYVTAESDELFNYWKPVLTAAEATLLKPYKPKGKSKIGPILIPPETEILVTDPTCESDVLAYADQVGIPYVKPEWLVQTIITGEKVDFAGHKKYSVGDLGDEDDNDNH